MLFSALILGFAGSLHCVGMCSPLLISITSLRKHAILHRIVYNLGRVLTYGILGSLVTLFGSMIIFPQFQTAISFALGLALVVLGAAEITTLKIPVVTGLVLRLTGFIKKKYATFLYRKSTLSVFAMGMLNGVLPCGLTYIALTYCLTTQNFYESIAFMLMFGVGTLPAMIGGSSVIIFLVKRLSLKISNLTTITVISLGIMLLARPLLIHQHHPAPHTITAPDNITICTGDSYKKI